MYNTLITRRRYSCRLRDAGRKALIILLLLPFCILSQAQTHPNGLVKASVDPHQDSLFIRQMKIKMSRIRATEHRPTVGLVLSGGGAKGAAEIGALKMLKEKDIPIDIICGTSIGGLIGALTAIGYEPEEIEELFLTQKWGITLTDKIPNQYYSREIKDHDNRYMISIPFLYEKGFREEVQRLGTGHERKGQSRSVLNSLPSGYAYGFNVNNLLSSLTVGFHDSTAFDTLPIPFMCVASDLISYKEKNWVNGDLKQAMRSTMSIPGLFDPVRTNGMVLVDGGLRNNYPVDILKAIGVDYIIGVDLSDADPGYEEVNNIKDVMSQIISMLGDDSFSYNKDKADIKIKPDLTGYDMLSFSKTAIDTMIARGRKSAEAVAGKLDTLKTKMNGAGQRILTKTATDIRKKSVKINSIRFEGVSQTESEYLLRLIDIDNKGSVNADIINDAMCKLQATKCFEKVSYSLLGAGNPYQLVFSLVKSPVHQLSIGIHLDTEEWAEVALAAELNVHKLTGSKAKFELKVGESQKARLSYSLNLPKFSTINAEAKIALIRADLNSSFQNASYNATFWTHQEKIFFSNARWTAIDAKFGIQNRFFGMPQKWFLTNLDKAILSKDISSNYFGAFLHGDILTFDKMNFPHKGISAGVGIDYDFVMSGNSEFKPILALNANISGVIPVGNQFALIPGVHARGVWDNNKDRSIAHVNFAGGTMAGRYMDQQVAFPCFQFMYPFGDLMAVTQINIRYNPLKDLYLSAIGGHIFSAKQYDFLKEGIKMHTYGGAFEAAYDTIVGPVKLDIMWSDFTKWGWQISLGFDF